MATVSDLPDLALERVFAFVPWSDLWTSARGACKRWNLLAFARFPPTIALSTPDLIRIRRQKIVLSDRFPVIDGLRIHFTVRQLPVVDLAGVRPARLRIKVSGSTRGKRKTVVPHILASLGDLSSLRALNVSGTSVSDTDIDNLRSSCPALEALSIAQCSCITSFGFAAAVRIPSLRILDASNLYVKDVERATSWYSQDATVDQTSVMKTVDARLWDLAIS
jgi:hypothetical protein